MIAVISAILITVGIVLLLDLTPESVTADIVKLLDYEQSFALQAREAREQKPSKKIVTEVNMVRDALKLMGKERQFALMCTATLGLFVSGAIISILIDNFFLIPVLSVAFAMIPFLYIKSSLKYFEKSISDELETSLSIITTSYVRNDDIVLAVRENIKYIRPPIRDIMVSFITQSTVINADMKSSIVVLKNSINNYIFKEWCDALIACQDDRTLKTTLMPIVTKFTDVRQVNDELRTMTYEPRSEYYTMVALVVANYPLLFVLNKEWFDVLFHSLLGKAIIAITAVMIFITAIYMVKFTRPIEFKK